MWYKYMSDISCPTWILEPYTHSGLKICPIICQLPNSTVLRDIQLKGQFNEVIVKQMINVLYQFQGRPLPGSPLVAKFKPFMDSDYDIFIVMFQKDFIQSSQTVVLATRRIDKDLLAKFNNNKVNGAILKMQDPAFLVSLKVLTTAGALMMGYFGHSPDPNPENDQFKLARKKIT